MTTFLYIAGALLAWSALVVLAMFGINKPEAGE